MTPFISPTANPVFFRTYSRRFDEQREGWDDVCDRTVKSLIKLGCLTRGEAELVMRMQEGLKTFPSGRWLWVGGTKWLESPENFYGSYNCLHGDTRVLTKRGHFPIRELAEAGNPVEVINANGEWSSVLFKSHGKQKVVPVTFSRAGGVQKTVLATLDHRWVTAKGVFYTHDLPVGVKIDRLFSPKPSIDMDGVRHGIIYGDGTQSGNNFFVDLQGEKYDDLKGYFEDVRELKWQNRAYCPGVDLKSLPDPSKVSLEYLRGFIVGLIATDGGVTGSIASVSGNENTMAFLSMYAPCVGYGINNISKNYSAGQESNLGIRKSDVWVATFCKASLDRTDFLRAKHLRNFLSTPMRKSQYSWKVKSVDTFMADFQETEVFCCQESTTHAFVLEDGLLTGNCSSLRITDWRAFRLLMDLAMMGTGTGAMLENRFIDYLPTIITHLDVKVIGEIGSVDPDKRRENTEFRIKGEYEDIHAVITVGDSRKGWVDSYHHLLEASSSDYGVKRLRVLVDVSNVRPSGEPLKGFGGTSNPSMLEGLYTKVAKVLNKANGRNLTAVECCLIIDEAALVIVSGNIRRCLAYGSMVSTDKGRKAIQDIQIGDNVLTSKGYYPVTDKFNQGVQKVCRVTTSGGHLHCTSRHKVALWENGSYSMVPAGSLMTGDRLLRVSENGAKAPDRVLSVEWDIKTTETFDIEVAEVHEFVCEGVLVHNSAGMKQGSSTDEEFAQAKLNLWQQDDAGNWRIDPERDALRMSNHTRVFHTRPTEKECIDAVRQQYYSGEGAIQWAGEAVARANADLFPERSQQVKFIKAYEEGRGEAYLRKVSPGMPERELKHRMERWGLNPCGEIVMADGMCNLSEIHLNNIDPFNFKEQEEAFKAGGIMVASLLHHKFPEERLAYSRELDPIVGVSFTGLFDFFVNAFGVDWLRWWEAGRPDDWGVSKEDLKIALDEGLEGLPGLISQKDQLILSSLHCYTEHEDLQAEYAIKTGARISNKAIFYKLVEKTYLCYWRKIVQETVWEYCDRHGLKRPNRYTTCQPAGSKSLLTGASAGWHPAKAQRFIRRITFGKNDPVALACIDYGYSVIPSQSDKDENGNLLNDPFDPRCTEWLVEIPVAVNWADLPGADEIDISKFSVLAQVDFAMQVQQHYVSHNTSATLEMREDEIEPLGKRIYQAIQNDEGYISAALLARFDDKQTYPRLPFEPIDKATYNRLSADVLTRQVTDDFKSALARYDKGDGDQAGPAGCDSDKCLLPLKKPE